jgi:hypothetical protein
LTLCQLARRLVTDITPPFQRLSCINKTTGWTFGVLDRSLSRQGRVMETDSQ